MCQIKRGFTGRLHICNHKTCGRMLHLVFSFFSVQDHFKEINRMEQWLLEYLRRICKSERLCFPNDLSFVIQ